MYMLWKFLFSIQHLAFPTSPKKVWDYREKKIAAFASHIKQSNFDISKGVLHMTIPLSLIRLQLKSYRKPPGLYRATVIDQQMCILLLSSATAVASPLHPEVY